MTVLVLQLLMVSVMLDAHITFMSCLCLYHFASYFACLAVNTVGHCQSLIRC